MADLKQQLDAINQKINNGLNFVVNKLKNFKNLSLGEQISYPSVILGLILVLTSLVMFII
tara:strand:- start:1466 stop:1645 length:180 start_codon:yes stop_codon:yes gene_type:complete